MLSLLEQQIRLLPDELQERLQELVVRYNQAAEPAGIAALTTEHPEHPALVRVWAASDFVAHSCIQQPELLVKLLADLKITNLRTEADYRRLLQPRLQASLELDQLAEELRQFRQQEMMRIAWRELAGYSDFSATSIELSALATVCLDSAKRWLYEYLAQQEGLPLNDRGECVPFFIIGLGKLGGAELNFSSDVDLIFAYESAGKTQKTGLNNQDFFTKLSQQLIQLLHAKTASGFVFRVDMRLRPFGDSGALVLSKNSLKTYLQTQAREWERYPYLKSVIVSGGDDKANQSLLDLIFSYVYVPYVDYSIIETLRDMKRRINREVERKNLKDNIKIGIGGIREIEFIAQCMQLIRGGRDNRLQQRNLLSTLQGISRANLISPENCNKLSEYYVFLRNLENHLQMHGDLQTHTLPLTPLAQTQIAYSLGYADWESLVAQVDLVREEVHKIFLKQVKKPKQTLAKLGDSLDSYRYVTTWKYLLTQSIDSLPQVITELPIEFDRLLKSLLVEPLYQQLSAANKERFNWVMQLILAVLEVSYPDPLLSFKRLLQVIDPVLRRTQYLALLVENPKVIEQLVLLCTTSPWITDQIARFPRLLDELRDSRRLYAPLDLMELDNELRQLLLVLPGDERLMQLDCLREFKHAQILRVAAADIAGLLPLMKVSDHLTNTAITILQSVLEIAIKTVCESYQPPLPFNTLLEQHSFAIVAYGKLGGIELGYGSDLDLVFLYDDSAAFDYQIDQEQLSADEFYLLVAKQIIQILSMPTESGILYEIDLRLRPSGESGLLVSNLTAFLAYQLEQAWTWEHQALVRARVVAGSAVTSSKFIELRQKILSRTRERQTLQQAVLDMREKIQQAQKILPSKTEFDLKLGKGGITDIEFIMQYCVLYWSINYPDLLTYPDNIRIAEDLGKHQLLTMPEVELLCDAYRAYRARVHHLDLQNQSTIIEDLTGEFNEFRRGVSQIWQRLLAMDELIE